ncbi:hypothetical protein [Bacteroides sedimenti]|uniref:DUF4276 family protein n=1 Tax=Bacteroides sedimenti TaxID=2136147 RepID=A0ABM8I8I4_9BACE
MELSKIVIYVDGPTEEGALKVKFCKEYYNNPEFRYGPGNGVNYSVEGYAKNVAPKIIFNLNSNIQAVILIPDLEKREKKDGISFKRFAEKIKKTIVSVISEKCSFTEEYLNNVIYVCPSDIMFENWIISDVEGIKSNSLIKNDCMQMYYDGKNGSCVLKNIMKEKYKKTVHAQALYKYVNSEVGMKYSPSYSNFISTIYELISK